MEMRHLGGHCNITHTDEGALKWLKGMGHNTLLDVGCSMGGQVAEALKLGFNAYGFDGDYNLTANPAIPPHILGRISFNDLTKCAYISPIQFDCIWCVEVAEHIEEKYTPNLLATIGKNLKKGGHVVFTANEGPGVHHVNKQPPFWWKAKMQGWGGLSYSDALTDELKIHSTMKREFIKKTGMVFIRE